MSEIKKLLKLIKSKEILIHNLKYYLNRIFGINFYSRIKYPLNDIKIKINYIDKYHWKLLEKKKWEYNCIKLLTSIVKKGQTILDIGAWKGQFTLLLSKLVGENGKIYAFEPDFLAYNRLRENIKINKINNVNVEKIGLSNFSGRSKFYIFGNGGGSGSSLILTHPNLNFKLEDIKITTIDKYCKDKMINPDGIKIDVEGAETMVLDGCKKVIENKNLWILLEFHGIYMSEKERIKNWSKIIKSAKKVIFINGNSNYFHYGNEIKNFPDCNYFHIFLQY